MMLNIIINYLASLINKNDFENGMLLMKHFENYNDEILDLIDMAFEEKKYSVIIFIAEVILNGTLYSGYMNIILLKLCHKNIFFPIHHIIKKSIKTGLYKKIAQNNFNFFDTFILSFYFCNPMHLQFMHHFTMYCINLSHKISNMWCVQFKSAFRTFDLSQPSLFCVDTIRKCGLSATHMYGQIDKLYL